MTCACFQAKPGEVVLRCEPPTLNFGQCFSGVEQVESLRLVNSSSRTLYARLDGAAAHNELSIVASRDVGNASASAVVAAAAASAVGSGVQATTALSMRTLLGGDRRNAKATSGAASLTLSLAPGAGVAVRVKFLPTLDDALTVSNCLFVCFCCLLLVFVLIHIMRLCINVHALQFIGCVKSCKHSEPVKVNINTKLLCSFSRVPVELVG